MLSTWHVYLLKIQDSVYICDGVVAVCQGLESATEGFFLLLSEMHQMCRSPFRFLKLRGCCCILGSPVNEGAMPKNQLAITDIEQSR